VTPPVHARPRRLPAFIALCGLSLTLAAPAVAQKVRVQVARGPHYVGEQINVEVVAEGFEENPQPEIRPPQPARGQLAFHGVSPQVSSSITIVNGQMTQSRRVSFTYHFRFIADEPGPLQLRPFILEQNGVTRATAPVELKLREIPASRELAVQLRLPDGPLFVGQRVKVGIDFLIDRELQRNLVSYALRVPLFDNSPFRFLDEPASDAKTELQVQTASGTLMLAGSYQEVSRGGRTYLRFTAERTMIPLEAGTFTTSPPSVIVNQGTKYRRDLFGSRQATSVRKLMARGQPATLEVVEVPTVGRPASFGGAIGRGYTLEVTADRSVVQVGEPIVLHFLLRGDGDLTTTSLPPLNNPGLLDPQFFRVPGDPPPGLIEDDGKHFEATVRVLDSSVREIPALSYSWFDADSRRFETTHSRPISVSVGAAQVVGANAVERRAAERAVPAPPTREPAGAGDGRTRRGSLALSGADLAIERDLAVLRRDDRAAGANGLWIATLYALGLTSLTLAFFDRRRRDLDPAAGARHRALTRGRSEVEEALSRPGPEAAGAIATALRAMLAEVPDFGDAQLDTLLGECDTYSYAPTGDRSTALPDELQRRAAEMARRLEEAGT